MVVAYISKFWELHKCHFCKISEHNLYEAGRKEKIVLSQ
jgi:hypothetical protein